MASPTPRTTSRTGPKVHEHDEVVGLAGGRPPVFILVEPFVPHVPVEFGLMAARSLPLQRTGGVSARGFTLIETLLAISIFSVMAVVVTFTMFGGVKEKYLDEGSQQFETVLRMVRSEAANQGRRMRLSWNSTEERIVVLWEPQPLAQPGQFVEYTSGSWVSFLPNDTIRIVGSRREGLSEEDALTFGSSAAAKSPSAMREAGDQIILDFYPDGSCDTTIIEIASRDEGDTRIAAVQIDGMNYFITTRIMAGEELASWREEMKVSAEGARGY